MEVSKGVGLTEVIIGWEDIVGSELCFIGCSEQEWNSRKHWIYCSWIFQTVIQRSPHTLANPLQQDWLVFVVFVEVECWIEF